MNIYIGIAAYGLLAAFYSDHLIDRLRKGLYRESLVGLLAVIGYGLLVCHLAGDALTSPGTGMPPAAATAAPATH